MNKRGVRTRGRKSHRLEKPIAKDAAISVGDDHEVVTRRNKIVVRKSSTRKFNLTEVVTRMPRDYRVVEQSFGSPVGREEW